LFTILVLRDSVSFFALVVPRVFTAFRWVFMLHVGFLSKRSTIFCQFRAYKDGPDHVLPPSLRLLPPTYSRIHMRRSRSHRRARNLK
jgi:hypothetical protein